MDWGGVAFRTGAGWPGAGLSGDFAGGCGVVDVAAVDEASDDTGGAGVGAWMMRVLVAVAVVSIRWKD